ncbi:MAG TPA: SusC/RagA family TonB-linked outer membrane protein [Saprospiraceae bacterium]|nr:SusC/RagA family TonB-linked outer membrane protein [Saprospiraceae bacterium]
MDGNLLFVKKLAFSFFLICTCSLTLTSQRTIHGKVTDPKTSEGLIGANVVVKGSTVGTVTDFDGSYSINIPAGRDVLTFSYTGYETVEVSLTGSDELNVSLGEGKLLDEVVLIGYGTVRRDDVTGSLQTVSSKDFNKGSITGAQELLAGKIAGVVINTGGAPGEAGVIRIRGESSLGSSSEPLIVIDGVPIESNNISGGRNPLNIINPNDIESFTVLKDASATAIYGNRASGGVILITTKKGALGGKMRVGYNGSVSVGNITDYIDVLTGDEYRALAHVHPDSTKIIPLLDTLNTDWQKEIYQTAIGHDHNLYLSGGVAQVPYRVSLGFSDKDGVLKTDEFKRISAGFNLNPGFINNTLQVNLHFKSMFTQNQFADRGAIGNALNFDPTHAVRDTSENNPYGGFTTWEVNSGLIPNTISPTNPVALLELKDDHSNETQYLTNVVIDYRLPFLRGLRANLNLAYDYHKGEGEVNVPTHAAFAYDLTYGGGTHNTYSQTKENTLLEFYLNYKTIVNKHSFDLMGGYSWQHFERDNKFRNSDVAGSPIRTSVDSLNPSELYLLAFFGRFNYSFDDRYLLTLSLRKDGTSRFSPENRWGLFPAAALAIKLIDNENSKFNSLKLRLSWGITGQQAINNDDYYTYLAQYQYGNESAQYQFGENFYRTYRANGYDANIKWEETKTYNLGLDFSIIRDRLSGSVDIYKRYTKDLLNRIPVPAGTNLTNFVTTNIGNMENQGLEFSLFATPVSTGSFRWEVSANVAYNKNEITKLTATDDPNYEGVLTGGISGGVGSNIQIHSVGYAPRSFFVYEQVYDAAGNIMEGVFVDRNGDGIVNSDDKYRYQNPSPDFTFGFSNRFELGRFDLSFAGRASVGNYVYNNVQTDRGYLSRLYLSTGGESLWNVTQSAVDLNVFSQANLTFSDHFVTKADFIKLDHVTAGYNFNFKSGRFIRLYVTIQNALTITSYEGLDPELFSRGTGPEIVAGIDQNIYPRPRTMVFGVSVEF